MFSQKILTTVLMTFLFIGMASIALTVDAEAAKSGKQSKGGSVKKSKGVKSTPKSPKTKKSNHKPKKPVKSTTKRESFVAKLPKNVQIKLKEAPPGYAVLGHHSGYLTFSKKTGMRCFSVPSKDWTWNKNKKFLDSIANRRDTVYLSTQANKVKEGSYLEKEIKHLTKKKNYKISEDGWSLLPP